MKILVIVFSFLFTINLHAEECSSERAVRLKQMIENNSLGKMDVKHGKLVKFTHHDYSISCAITLESGQYHWFTDENETFFIIEEKTKGQSNYYGLFQ